MISYRATEQSPYQVAAGAVVVNDGKVLVLHRHNEPGGARGGYHLPKGTLEQGESLEECAIREVGEESGYRIKLVDYLGATHTEFVHPGSKMPTDKIVHYFFAKLEESTVIQPKDAEHDEVMWISIEDALTKLSGMPKSEDLIVKRALKHVNTK